MTQKRLYMDSDYKDLRDGLDKLRALLSSSVANSLSKSTKEELTGLQQDICLQIVLSEVESMSRFVVEGRKDPSKLVMLLSIIHEMKKKKDKSEIVVDDDLIQQFQDSWWAYVVDNAQFSPRFLSTFKKMEEEPFFKIVGYTAHLSRELTMVISNIDSVSMLESSLVSLITGGKVVVSTASDIEGNDAKGVIRDLGLELSESLEAIKAQLKNIKRDKNGVWIAPHKPILLMAVADMVKDGSITDDCIVLSNPQLRTVFSAIWEKKVLPDSPYLCDWRDPFNKLANEPFWTLEYPGVSAKISKKLYDVLKKYNNIIKGELEKLIDCQKTESLKVAVERRVEQVKEIDLFESNNNVTEARDFVTFPMVLGFRKFLERKKMSLPDVSKHVSNSTSDIINVYAKKYVSTGSLYDIKHMVDLVDITKKMLDLRNMVFVESYSKTMELYIEYFKHCREGSPYIKSHPSLLTERWRWNDATVRTLQEMFYKRHKVYEIARRINFDDNEVQRMIKILDL